jgi:hypothetical protein
VIQRLFFYRINAKSAGASIRCEDYLVFFSLANKTKPPLSIVQPALPWANVALNSAVIQFLPVSPRMIHFSLHEYFFVSITGNFFQSQC